VVTLAGLINATKLTNRELKNCKAVLVGAGAAGNAIAKLLNLYAPGIKIVPVDSKGVMYKGRGQLNDSKEALLEFTNPDNVKGSLADALKDADIFIGVSQPGLLTEEMIKTMAKDPIIFAMANPTPEIFPDEAKAAGAAIVATGRSDFPNQVNNALAFPGIFRGALDNKVQHITDQHKIAAADAIAKLIPKPTANKILPPVLDKRLVPAIEKIIR